MKKSRKKLDQIFKAMNTLMETGLIDRYEISQEWNLEVTFFTGKVIVSEVTEIEK